MGKDQLDFTELVEAEQLIQSLVDQIKQEVTPASTAVTDVGHEVVLQPAQVQTTLEALKQEPALLQLSSPQRHPGSWQWLLGGLTALCAIGGTGGAALFWLMTIPPAPNCQDTSPLSPDMERLYCAQKAAESGELPELLAALKLVGTWTPEHPLYHQAQQSVNRWSELLLAIAQRKIEQSDLKGAVNLARQIPKTSTIHKDAQASINRWQAQWQRGETITIAAQAAMKRGNWTQASEKILAMRELEYSYWRFQQANSLARQMVLEKRARQFLSQARALAKLGGMEQLQQAITQASKMNPKTYAWSDAQKEMKRWGETLLTQSWQQWQAGDLQAAIAIARPVVAVPTLTKEAEALIRLSEARQLARTTDWRWQPKPHHVWHLMEAVAIASQVKPDSRFYAQAQASLAQWRNALEDVSQLQLAQWLTDLNHPAALKLAVAKAEQVSRHRPRRLQAQNLIAHWNREIERMEDAPLLAQARQLAQKGAIANLQAAIAQAQKISPQRALRGEAQALVHDWTQQIQTLQDKPLLDKAWALANQGQLGAAIQVAAQIKAGRSLYGEAQWAIGDWHYQIQQSLLAKTQAPVIAPIEDPIREPYADETPSWSQREPEPQYEEPAPTYQKSDRDKQPPTYRESEPQYEEPPLPTYRDPAYSDVPFPAPPASLPELPPADQAPPLPPAPLPTVDESLPPPAAVPTASPTASETVVEPIVEQPTPANLLSDAS